MKNSFEYSFHQQHHLQLHHPVPQPVDQVLDLSKRRDSTESRKTTSPSSYEDGSPDLRTSPTNQSAQHLIHRHIHIPKPPFTPEHTIQYHYKYEHPSPTSTNAIKNTPIRSSPEMYERFNGSPMLRKDENVSPQPEEKLSTPFFHARPNLPEEHHEDSNDLPAITSNISSSSSSASSQKSPSSSASNGMMVVGRDGKLSRPFKAYPRDPLSLAAAGSILDSASAEKYSMFRKRMLEQIHAANGGNPVINNPKMRRITKSMSLETNNNELSYEPCEKKLLLSPSSGNDKDEAYFERRKKNNAAAKKSRDRRRIKEDEIAIRAAYLERENIELKFELAAARKQLSLYNSGIGSN